MMHFKYGELISMFLFQDATEADVRYLSIINTVFFYCGVAFISRQPTPQAGEPEVATFVPPGEGWSKKKDSADEYFVGKTSKGSHRSQQNASSTPIPTMAPAESPVSVSDVAPMKHKGKQSLALNSAAESRKAQIRAGKYINCLSCGYIEFQ